MLRYTTRGAWIAFAIVVVTLIALAIALAGCGTVNKPGPLATQTPPLPVQTQQPVVTYTPPPSPIQAWWDNGGSSSWDTVASDVSQLNTDAADQDLPAVEQDGAQLKTDALAAEQDGPPAGTDGPAYYFGTMAALAFAGTAMTLGDLTLATSYMTTANTDITNFKAEALGEGLDVNS